MGSICCGPFLSMKVTVTIATILNFHGDFNGHEHNYVMYKQTLIYLLNFPLTEAIKREQVVDVFVLCTRGELHKYRVPSLIQHLKDGDLTVHQFPFPDGSSPSFEDAIKMLDALKENLKQSRKCLVQ